MMLWKVGTTSYSLKMDCSPFINLLILLEMVYFNFWLSLLSLLVPVVGGFYFLQKWLVSQRKHAYFLFFGLSLLFILLFKVPNILINAGLEILPTSLNPYFLITLTLHLVSFYFLVKGFLHFYQQSQRKVEPFFYSLVTLLLVYYFISFFVPFAPFPLPVWLGHIFFFIPAQLITLLIFYKINNTALGLNSVRSKFFIIWSLYLLFATSIAYIYTQTGPSSQTLWYVYVTLSWGISALQIFSMFFLFLGLYFMTKEKTRSTTTRS